MSLEPSLIEHCAPTLARLKVGSLFSLISPCWENLYAEAAQLSRQLRPKGLALRIIPAGESRALCYLYRERLLADTLRGAPEAAFLRSSGYSSVCVQDALNTLCCRLARGGDFPHEVGLFLGYPLSDVIAFIENKGRDCVCCGCWKCYGDACEAKRLFALYDKCTEVYRRLYRAGRTLCELTVSA